MVISNLLNIGEISLNFPSCFNSQNDDFSEKKSEIIIFLIISYVLSQLKLSR